MRVAVVGASGYTGLELMRILLRHPHFEVVAATSEQRAGAAVGDAFPSLRGCQDLVFESNDPATPVRRLPLVADCLAPVIRLAPETTDFGDVGLGCAEVRDISISNVGRAPVRSTVSRRSSCHWRFRELSQAR